MRTTTNNHFFITLKGGCQCAAELLKGFYFMTYSEKLRDPRWQRKRLEVFNRDNWTCTRCGDNENTLAIHHLYYRYNTEPWDYVNEALVTVCELCHEKYEFLKWVDRHGLFALTEDFDQNDILLIHNVINCFTWLYTDPDQAREYMSNIKILCKCQKD